MQFQKWLLLTNETNRASSNFQSYDASSIFSIIKDPVFFFAFLLVRFSIYEELF